ncbi:MAG: phosphoribosylglycinamide formyltransferase [Ichthyobacteriaceae bacterium]|nr:phosphoribosylglycinamide formyltransferase [Ichthyobacteriaceae bacterium]
MTRIAIFASGSGSNAQNIAEYFADKNEFSISLILANKPDAYVLNRAKNLNIPSFVFTNKEFQTSEIVINKLKEHKIDFIVLAGFLLKVPSNLINAFNNKIVNIHPALLPNYGGKGMYGMNVHNSVIENKETESGITIHYVNENYDEGQIIFQAKTLITPNDDAESLASKIHILEYKYFPEIIEGAIRG